MLNRRAFLKAVGSIAATTGALGGLASYAYAKENSGGHVIVVGGGWGGNTAAKYLRMWSNGAIKVTLIEPSSRFVSCPISNLVVGGLKQIDDITMSYETLSKRWGVNLVHDRVTRIDVAARKVGLSNGDTLDYDRLVLSPGIDFLTDEIEGLSGNEERIPHAWKAGPQTALLRQQLEAMEDGGVVAIHIPKVPYRCPPGPYERACLVSNYLKQHKPRSKVLLLDANPDIQSKKGLFQAAFAERYSGILEYVPNSTLLSVDASSLTAELEFSEVKADVLNVIPPMRSGRLVDQLGVELINDRWVDVDWLTMEAKGAPNVHVLGDATFPAPTMPKSGHMANQHGKIAAAAIINLLAGQAPNPAPVAVNTCYSFVDDTNVIHVASVHQFDAEKGTLMPVEGAGGVSSAPNAFEGRYALSWANNVWTDMLG